MEMLNGVYCLAELLEFAAFLQLRRRHPNLRRPYKVPLGFWGCTVLLAGPSIMCLLLLIQPFLPSVGGRLSTAVFTGGCAVAGVLLYAVMAVCRRWWPSSFIHPQ